MRLLLLFIIFFSSVSAGAQDCKPNTTSKISVIGSACQDTIFANCFRKLTGLKAVDDKLTIMSYIVTLDCAGCQLPAEVLNTGGDLNEAKKLIKYFRPGIFVEFNCIKAKDANGRIYILQPLVFQLK